MTDNMTMTRRERRVQRLADLVAERKAFEAELAAKKAAIEAEERADAKAVKDAFKYAGEARCAAVEELYELFGITEEVTERMTKNGTVRRVRKDRGEAKRAARLVEAVVALKARGAASEASLEQAEEPVLEDGETVAYGAIHEGDEEREDAHERGFSVYGA